MNDTPNSNRTHIAIFGRTNAGKSSIINAIANQNVAIVSDKAGTTTDPVKKAIEINKIGACVIVDTAGFDDNGDLGLLRIEKTKKIAEKTDIALLVFDCNIKNNDYILELKWKNQLSEFGIPIIAVINKIDFPSFVNDFIIFINSSISFGVKTAVGSSNISISLSL